MELHDLCFEKNEKKIRELLKNRIPLIEVKPENDGKKATVSGFFRNLRDIKKIKFAIIDDGTSDAQITIKKGEIDDDKFELISKIPLESVILFSGYVKKSEISKRGVEFIANDLYILSLNKEKELPVDLVKDTTLLDKRMDYRFLDLRIYKHRLPILILSDFLNYSREFLLKNRFVEISSPKLLGMPSEGGAEVFEVKYFDRTAYLAQSPQLYKQMALCAGFERVLEIAPAFRAEPSFTTRHTTEFLSFDIEMAYISSFEDVMNIEEEMLKYTLKKIKEKWEDDVEKYLGVEINVPTKRFPRITMEEAVEIVKSNGGDEYINPEGDLGAKGEKIIGNYVKEEYDNEFLFLTIFPWEARPFYHMKTKDQKHTLSFDLIYRGVEVTTGAQREHRYDILVKQAKEKGLNIENLKTYLEFFKYGAPPHGGFGMGPSRVIKQMLNLENIREAMLIARDPKRLNP